MGYALDAWLGEADNFELWTSAQFPMWKKRVLITRLAAEAWEHVCARFDFERAATRIGMLMTIDGSGDELIKIQGVPQYSFSDADAGETTGTSSDPVQHGEDPDEQAILESIIPEEGEDSDADGGEDGGDAPGDEERLAFDSFDEEDDDTSEFVSSVGRAPVVPPQGFKYVETMPCMNTVADQQLVVGKYILHAWDAPNIRGWFMGRVSARGVSHSDMRQTPTANYVVTYDKKVTKNRHLHGRVASSLIEAKYGPDEWWIMLEKDV